MFDSGQMTRSRPGLDPDRLLIARLDGIAQRHARWGAATEDELAAGVAELRELAGHRPDLFAEVAGIALGTSEAKGPEYIARAQAVAGLCRLAGADEALIPEWAEEGRRRAEAARLPRSADRVVPHRVHHRSVQRTKRIGLLARWWPPAISSGRHPTQGGFPTTRHSAVRMSRTDHAVGPCFAVEVDRAVNASRLVGFARQYLAGLMVRADSAARRTSAAAQMDGRGPACPAAPQARPRDTWRPPEHCAAAHRKRPRDILGLHAGCMSASFCFTPDPQRLQGGVIKVAAVVLAHDPSKRTHLGYVRTST